MVLATGVSSMHYLGQSGTSFYVPKNPKRLQDVLHTNDSQSVGTAIAIGAMCGAIIITSFVLTMSDMLDVQAARERARKIVVCSATFDKQDRLLVRPDGTVPMVVIETEIQPKDMLHYLDRRQPLFQWLYAISWDWAMTSPFVRCIDAYFRREQPSANSNGLERNPLLKRVINRIRPKQADTCPLEDEDKLGGPGNIDLGEFKDRYIWAANQLSVELNISMENVGVLYDRVFPNGSLLEQEQQAEKKRQRRSRKLAKAQAAALQSEKPGTEQDPGDEASRQDDASSISSGPVSSIFHEQGSDQEGLLLFLVREVGNGNSSDAQQELDFYGQKGYRMTETRFLSRVLSDRLSVPKDDMTDMLNSLKLYSKRGTRPVVQPGGVYVGMFGVRPTTSIYGGLDVLTYGFARHMIPSYRVPDVGRVTPEMRAFLRVLDQMSLDEAMRTCERESIRSGEKRQYLNQDGIIPADAEEELIQFQMALFLALDALANAMSFYPRIAQSSRLSAELLEVPSSLDDSTPPALMILTQAVLPSEDATAHPYGDLSALPDPDMVPTETCGKGTPFVFVPYTLFAKAQMMLFRGQQAAEFEDEVIAELRRRHPDMLMAGGIGEGSPADEDMSRRSGGGGLTSRNAMRHPLATLAAATGLGAAAQSGGSELRSGRSDRTGPGLSGRGATGGGHATQPSRSLGQGTMGTLGTMGDGAGTAARRSRNRMRIRHNPEAYELTSRLRLDGGGAGSQPSGSASAQIAQQWTAKEGQAEADLSDEKGSEEHQSQIQLMSSSYGSASTKPAPFHSKSESTSTSAPAGENVASFVTPVTLSPPSTDGAGLLSSAPAAGGSLGKVQVQWTHEPHTSCDGRESGPMSDRDTVPGEILSDRSGRSGWSGRSNHSARRMRGGNVLEVDTPAPSAEVNEDSLRARLTSDDWSSRQLEALGRGQAGPLLLGVDY